MEKWEKIKYFLVRETTRRNIFFAGCVIPEILLLFNNLYVETAVIFIIRAILFAIIGLWAVEVLDDSRWKITIASILLVFMFGSSIPALYFVPGINSIVVLISQVLIDYYAISEKLDEIAKPIERKIEAMNDLFEECEYIENQKK